MKFSKNVDNKKCATKLNFFNDFFLETSIFKAFKALFTKIVPIFCRLIGKKYENDLRVIFDQWSKLTLGLDVRPEIPILKVIY